MPAGGGGRVSLYDMVEKLRTEFPEYERIKLQLFVPVVRRALDKHQQKQLGTRCDGEKVEPEPEVDLITKSTSALKADSTEDESASDTNPMTKEPLDTSDGSAVEQTPSVATAQKGASGMTAGPKFSDFGGIQSVLDDLIKDVLVPLFHPEVARELGIRPISGILLHGPPGCGKTTLAHAIANEAKVPLYKICSTEIISSYYGKSEAKIRDLFRKAYNNAPSIVLIDEIDAISPKKEDADESNIKIMTQLMSCMDESNQMLMGTNTDLDWNTSKKKSAGYVLVIGTTNRADSVDPTLRRPGRFDKEIVLGVPDEYARKEILSVLAKKYKLDSTFDLLKIARSTPGYVGADLTALANEAGNIAVRRILDIRKTLYVTADNDHDWWEKPWTPDEVQSLSITKGDFEKALNRVQPSLRREGFSPVPHVKWDDVGGLNSLREEFQLHVVQQIKNPEIFKRFGLASETGFLLYGPPGCGKTLIAKAVAHEAGTNFIHVKGPELLNKYVGESELAVRTLFSRARACAPCIIFFDEINALTTDRRKEEDWVVKRILDQLLIELDGADKRHGVHVIGATNRPEVIDSALKRPGRLGKEIYVPLPNAEERAVILKISARNMPLAADVDLDAIGRSSACENFSGADLNAVVAKAAALAVADCLKSMDTQLIKKRHFEQAFMSVHPSVSEEERKYYEDYRRRKGL